MNCSEKALIVLGDVCDLLLKKGKVFLCNFKLFPEVNFGLDPRMDLVLEPYYF